LGTKKYIMNLLTKTESNTIHKEREGHPLSQQIECVCKQTSFLTLSTNIRESII